MYKLAFFRIHIIYIYIYKIWENKAKLIIKLTKITPGHPNFHAGPTNTSVAHFVKGPSPTAKRANTENIPPPKPIKSTQLYWDLHVSIPLALKPRNLTASTWHNTKG